MSVRVKTQGSGSANVTVATVSIAASSRTDLVRIAVPHDRARTARAVVDDRTIGDAAEELCRKLEVPGVLGESGSGEEESGENNGTHQAGSEFDRRAMRGR